MSHPEQTNKVILNSFQDLPRRRLPFRFVTT